MINKTALYREVWMTSEDTGAYGRDIGVTLPDLLYEFVKIIPEGCMLRLGTLLFLTTIQFFFLLRVCSYGPLLTRGSQ